MKENVFSNTAMNVIQGLLYVSKNRDLLHLIPDESIILLKKILRSTSDGKKRLKQLDSRLFNMMIPIIERVLAPGITLHYALRKKYIEDNVRTSILKGTKLVVNLGAGFDTLMYRLSKEFSDVTFIEIDHPETQQIKKQIFLNDDSTNLQLIPVDFTKQNLDDVLRAIPCLFNINKVYYIAESVLMYLNIEDVDKLFFALKKISNQECSFLFTYLIKEKNQNFLLKYYLHKKAEQYLWYLNHNEVEGFIQKYGYKLESIVDSKELINRYSPDKNATIFKDEYIAIVR